MNRVSWREHSALSVRSDRLFHIIHMLLVPIRDFTTSPSARNRFDFSQVGWPLEVIGLTSSIHEQHFELDHLAVANDHVPHFAAKVCPGLTGGVVLPQLVARSQVRLHSFLHGADARTLWLESRHGSG
jgi:hypothetical protein